jgi:hypothetical protein
MTNDELGEAAYLAFLREWENANARATTPPNWNALDRRRRKAWVAAAREVRSMLRSEAIPQPEVHRIVKGAAS